MFGSFFALLAAGPLNGEIEAAILAGVTGGFLEAGLWVWQTRWVVISYQKGSQRLGRCLGLATLMIFLSLTILVAMEHYQLNPIGVPARDRTANFEQLWAHMNTLYPYFEIKGVDWQAVHSRYLPRVQAAADNMAYFSIIEEMLAELQDGHTVLREPYGNILCFGSARDVDGYAVVSDVGPTARKAGLQRGDILLALDGKPVDVYLLSLNPRFRSGSTPWNTRYISYPHLLDVPATGKLEVTFLGVDGKPQTISLQAPELKNASVPGTGEFSSPTSAIESERLPSGIGIIRISRFWDDPDEAVSKQFDAALNRMMDAPGIILDMRGNGGGNSLIADAIAGRFSGKIFYYGHEFFRRPIFLHAWRMRNAYRVTPRQPVYGGKLALIIDAGCFSSTEMFIASLVDSGRARTVGQTSGGGSGNPVTFKLTGGGVAAFSTGDFIRMNGQRIEGKGIAPDIPVRRTLEDFRQGRDPEQKAAEAYLLSANP